MVGEGEKEGKGGGRSGEVRYRGKGEPLYLYCCCCDFLPPPNPPRKSPTTQTIIIAQSLVFPRHPLPPPCTSFLLLLPSFLPFTFAFSCFLSSAASSLSHFLFLSQIPSIRRFLPLILYIFLFTPSFVPPISSFLSLSLYSFLHSHGRFL